VSRLLVKGHQTHTPSEMSAQILTAVSQQRDVPYSSDCVTHCSTGTISPLPSY
jgi:hypothetical protein